MKGNMEIRTFREAKGSNEIGRTFAPASSEPEKIFDATLTSGWDSHIHKSYRTHMKGHYK